MLLPHHVDTEAIWFRVDFGTCLFALGAGLELSAETAPKSEGSYCANDQ